MNTDDLRDVLASNVNEEAVVLFGVTTGELIMLTTLAVALTVPLFVFFGVAVDMLPLFITVSLPVIFVVVALIALLMQQIKRGRPEGYFQHRLELFKHTIGFGQHRFVTLHGSLSTLRTQQCLLVHKHLQQDAFNE